MSRKSLTKKEQTTWFQCEKCKANITTKDREQHAEFCPLADATHFTKCSFVRDNKLYSNQLMAKPPTDDYVRDLNQKQLNSLVFLSESAINLCGFIFGDYVVIRSIQQPSRAPVIRTVWPTSSNFSTTVFVSEEGEKNSAYHFKYVI